MRIPEKIQRVLQLSALPIILLAAFATRFVLAVTTFTSTIDTSTVGIMGMHILDGDRPLFYYGQNYMGALEGYCTALIFKIFGASITTLTLTPTFFAMGWAAAMYLVFRRIFNSRLAGLAAALCVAIPGWYTIWYTMGAYGGYPETYLFGTLAIWVTLRLTDETTDDFSLLNAILLGIFAALGIWTNLQVIPFLAVAAIIAGVHWLWTNRTWKRVLCLGTAGVIGLTGFVPGLIATAGTEESSFMASPKLAYITANSKIMLDRVIPRLIWWKSTDSALLTWLIGFVVTLPVLFYLVSVVRKRRTPQLAIPLLFAGIFIVLYLPHDMAALGAPRYAISLSVMLFAAGFSAMLCAEFRWVRICGWLLLAGWIGYNGVSLGDKCSRSGTEKRDKIDARMSAIEQAKVLDIENLMIIGGTADGLRGLIFSFYAKGDVRFIACRSDRVYQHVAAWENDDGAGYAISPGAIDLLTHAVKSMGITKYRVTDAGLYRFLDRIEPKFISQAAVPDVLVHDVRGFDGESDAVIDQIQSTYISTPTDRESSLTLALAEPKEISGLKLLGHEDDLPQGPYTVSVSSDGEAYTPVLRVDRRIPQCYRCGNRIYFKGHNAAHDIQFAPVTAQYVRIAFDIRPGRRSTWNLSEVFVLEHLWDAEPVAEQEPEDIAKSIAEKGINFTYGDRWISRKLEPLLAPDAVFPPYGGRHPHSQLDRTIAVGPGQALVIDNAMAEQAAALLNKHLPEGVTLQSDPHTHYTLMTFDCAVTAEPTRLPLTWYGQTVLAK